MSNKVVMRFNGHDIEGDAATLADINNKLTQYALLAFTPIALNPCPCNTGAYHLPTCPLFRDATVQATEAGPDHEWYWETWDDVINNAVITTPEGVVYTLEQDGDCWLVEQGAELCEQDDTYYVHKE